MSYELSNGERVMHAHEHEGVVYCLATSGLWWMLDKKRPEPKRLHSKSGVKAAERRVLRERFWAQVAQAGRNAEEAIVAATSPAGCVSASNAILAALKRQP